MVYRLSDRQTDGGGGGGGGGGGVSKNCRACVLTRGTG